MLCKIGLVEDNSMYFTANVTDFVIYDYKNIPTKIRQHYFSDTMRVLYDLPIKNKSKLTKKELMFFKKELNAKI